jgi:hypothetical protein
MYTNTMRVMPVDRVLRLLMTIFSCGMVEVIAHLPGLQTKQFQPQEVCFFLTSTFIERSRKPLPSGFPENIVFLAKITPYKPTRYLS